ncbi:MAG: anti-sigma factor, partial [Actinomycetota bacterium]
RSITSARSWSRPLAMVAGAAAVLLVGVPLYLGFSGSSAPDAEVELAAMDGWIGTGSAELEGRSLNVRVDGNAAPEGTFYELWLLDVDEGEQVEDLFWVGRVDVAADGSFEVPDDVDLSEFNVVDVSIEPDDGDPEHSGNSILRGGLTDA